MFAIKTLIAALIGSFPFLINFANASDWPSRPVRIIVPYSAGGAADALGRVFAEALGETFGQRFIIENRGGSGGSLGSEAVADALPDGYTLLISGMPSHVFAPMINKVRFDPMRDFKHIALLGGLPNILLVHPSVAITTFEQFLAFVRSQQGSVGYGSPGVGTVGHFLMEYLAKKETLNLHHIPYKGGGNAILDLLAGHVKIGIVSLQTIRGQISKRALNPIATVTANRAADFPDIPTLKELGYPELVAPMWFSLSGPRELSDEITARLNKAVVESLTNPRVRKYLVQESIETMPMTQVEFTAYVQSEIDKWQPIIKSLEKK